jgi:hypothetical protein
MNMESFSAAPQGEEEVPMTREELVNQIAEVESEIERLKALSIEKGENISPDVELGSEEYVDFGHMAEAEILEEQLEALKAALAAADDEVAFKIIADAAQRKLDI